MLRKTLLLLVCLCLLALQGLAADREINTGDLQGIPKKHRYVTFIVAGVAIGTGIGILLPGGGESAAKGALIGGSGASSMWLWSHRNAAGAWTPWAHIASNTGLAAGVGWTVCDCGAGFGIGALLGGGGTAAIQALGTRQEKLAKATGAGPPSTTAQQGKPPKP